MKKVIANFPKSETIVIQSLVKELVKEHCTKVVWTIVEETPPSMRREELLECCKQIVQSRLPFVRKTNPLVFERYVDLLRFKIAEHIPVAVGRPCMSPNSFL
jgi:hypothetical protein